MSDDAPLIPIDDVKVSAPGIAQLASFEGVVPTVYYDSAGTLSWGIGHTEAAGDPIPEEMTMDMPEDLENEVKHAFRVFAEDLLVYADDVRAALQDMHVRQYEFDAALSFHYNTGAIDTADWVEYWRDGDYAAAEEAIMNWSKPDEVIPRREAEQALWANGTYTSQQTSVWGTDGEGHVDWSEPVATLTFDRAVAIVNDL